MRDSNKQSNMNMKHFINIIILVLLPRRAYGGDATLNYHHQNHLIRGRHLQNSGSYIDCSDPSITLNECRKCVDLLAIRIMCLGQVLSPLSHSLFYSTSTYSTPYCTIVEVPGQSVHVGGKCLSDNDCYPVVRSASPSGSKTSVQLCDCYAGSTFDTSFDECEGDERSCKTAKCKNTCKGLRSFCPADARQLEFVASGPDADASAYPLDECQGDCDSDNECNGSLICFRREEGNDGTIPGCNGIDTSKTDYCIDPKSLSSEYPLLGELHHFYTLAEKEDVLDTKGLLGECWGECCSDYECRETSGSGQTCFWRNGTEDVPGCRGKGEADASYCINPRCKLGYCVYKEIPPDLEVMPAYWFAQLRCCLRGLDDENIDGEEFDREEYCNRVGYPRKSCPRDYEKGPSGCSKVCGYGCHECQLNCARAGGAASFEKWCCNAIENGPPVWWLSLRPNGNANQFCVDVGYDIGSCR